MITVVLFLLIFHVGFASIKEVQNKWFISHLFKLIHVLVTVHMKPCCFLKASGIAESFQMLLAWLLAIKCETLASSARWKSGNVGHPYAKRKFWHTVKYVSDAPAWILRAECNMRNPNWNVQWLKIQDKDWTSRMEVIALVQWHHSSISRKNKILD